MWIRKGFSFKLTPDGAQARKMSRFAGCTRFVYNKGIAWNEEQRNADPNFRISYKALSAQLPIWKENYPWLADTYSQCLLRSAVLTRLLISTTASFAFVPTSKTH